MSSAGASASRRALGNSRVRSAKGVAIGSPKRETRREVSVREVLDQAAANVPRSLFKAL